MKTTVKICSLVCILLLFGCAKSDRNIAVEEKFSPDVLAAAARATGEFSGTWAFNLNVKKDGCDLGVSGSFDADVVVAQNGKTGTATLSGFPSYKAKFKKRLMKANGKLNSDGTKINGRIRGKISKDNTSMNVKTSRFIVKVPGAKKCAITFKGTGVKS